MLLDKTGSHFLFKTALTVLKVAQNYRHHLDGTAPNPKQVCMHKRLTLSSIGIIDLSYKLHPTGYSGPIREKDNVFGIIYHL